MLDTSLFLVVYMVVSKYFKSSFKVVSLLNQKCLTPAQLKQIQSHLIVSGSISDPFAAGKLLALLSISHLSDALAVFGKLPHRSTYVWNTMIRACVDKNESFRAVCMYKWMLKSGFSPNNYTFSFVLRACVNLSDICLGLISHCQAIKLGWESYDFVQNGLIHLYVSCNSLRSARNLFDSSLNRDVITWTALINGYVKDGQIMIAHQLFDKMPEKNVVSWSAMITGYAQAGLFKEALDLFNAMQHAGFQPNHAGIVSALSACANSGALDQGKWIHAYIGRNEIELDVGLGTALIDMYGKCGCIETAYKVFDEMPQRDVFAYTCLISSLASHGQGRNAIELLSSMQNEGIKPNGVTFICILSVCSRVGLVKEGLRIFKSMKDVYGLEPGVEHYGCLVDLLGRAGFLDEAKKVVKEMPKDPDSYVLGALLNACRVHGDVELGIKMVEDLIGRRLDHSGIHVLLSNIHASANQWDDVEIVRKVMEEKRVKKVPGCSLIEIEGEVCEFVAGDKCNALMETVQFLLPAAPTSPAKIVSGIFSNMVSVLMKYLWSLKTTTKTAISSRPLMKFESGYTVETVFDGSKLGIEPHSVEVLPTGDLLILDSINSNLYKISSSLSLHSRPKLIAGSAEGYAGHVDGKLREAKMNHPTGLTADDRGNIYVADTANMAIRKISDAGVSTIAGGKISRGGGHVDGPSEDAKFSNDFDLVYIGSSCSLLVIDRGNQAIREIQLNYDDCAYQYASGFPLGIAVLAAAGFFGYMLALLQRRVSSIVNSQNNLESTRTTFPPPPYQKHEKLSVWPPLIPTEDDQEKQEEGFFGSLAKLLVNTGAVATEILGSVFPSLKKKPQINHNNYQAYSNSWPVQDSFVIGDGDEPPPPAAEARTPTPRKTYAFMTKDAEKMQQFRQSRNIYNGWDEQQMQRQQNNNSLWEEEYALLQQKKMQRQQQHHRHHSAAAETRYEQSNEKTNEIVFGAVQEKTEPVVIKPLDYSGNVYDRRKIKSRNI